MKLEALFPDWKGKPGYTVYAPKLRRVLKRFENVQPIKDLDEIAKGIPPQQKIKLYRTVREILELCIREGGYYDHEGLANINYVICTYLKKMSPPQDDSG